MRARYILELILEHAAPSEAARMRAALPLALAVTVALAANCSGHGRCASFPSPHCVCGAGRGGASCDKVKLDDEASEPPAVPAFTVDVGSTAALSVAVAGSSMNALKADDMQGGIAGPTRTFPRLNDRDWYQAGPSWVTTPAGALTPCDAVAEDGNLLVYTAEAFRSFELSFTFSNQEYMDSWSGGGVLFRADNCTSYDFWSFDSIAMQERAEAAWAVVGSVRGDGWRRAHQGLISVPGVGSAPGLVHHARVQLDSDGTLRSWVDEYPLPPQQLPPRTRPGRVGLYAYSMFGGGPRMIFSNVSVTGLNATDAPAFGVNADPATNRPWSIVAGPINRSNIPASPIDDSGQVGNAVVAPNGDVLALNGPNTRSILRSTDKGSTWRLERDKAPHADGRSYGGKLVTVGSVLHHLSANSTTGDLFKCTSTDSGHSFSPRRHVHTVVFGPQWCEGYPGVITSGSTGAAQRRPWTTESCTALLSGATADYRAMFTSVVLTQNGTILLFAPVSSRQEGATVMNRTYLFGAGLGDPPQAAPILKYNTVIRSSDEGETWGDPINLDGEGSAGGMMSYKPYTMPMNAKEASELSASEVSPGQLMVIVRPFWAPTVWQSRSLGSSDGATWGPVTRGAFPMYAMFNAMATTRSGVTIICGRFPAISCQASWDGGRSWRLFIVDVSSAQAQGSLVEVEPDVVLWIYGSRASSAGTGPWELRSQRLRVAHSPPGLRPEPPR